MHTYINALPQSILQMFVTARLKSPPLWTSVSFDAKELRMKYGAMVRRQWNHSIKISCWVMATVRWLAMMMDWAPTVAV